MKKNFKTSYVVERWRGGEATPTGVECRSHVVLGDDVPPPSTSSSSPGGCRCCTTAHVATSTTSPPRSPRQPRARRDRDPHCRHRTTRPPSRRPRPSSLAIPSVNTRHTRAVSASDRGSSDFHFVSPKTTSSCLIVPVHKPPDGVSRRNRNIRFTRRRTLRGERIKFCTMAEQRPFYRLRRS